MACGHRRNGDVPVVGHPPPGFTRSAVTHMGVTVTEALQLAEDRPFWWTIATAGGFGWTLCIMMMMMTNDKGIIIILVIFSNTTEALQQLPDLMFMHRLQLSVTHSITEHNDTIRQDVVDTVVVLQGTCVISNQLDMTSRSAKNSNWVKLTVGQTSPMTICTCIISNQLDTTSRSAKNSNWVKLTVGQTSPMTICTLDTTSRSAKNSNWVK